ncbi:DUF4245 family protein, partial [Streptomyces sp. SID7803]|nr:DUF4245 family protein [Streptomyces sp. SID7803]
MASKRGKQTVRDMILSLLAIAAVAGVVYIFIPHDDKADPVKAVDYRVELLTARRAAPYPVAAPEGLPAGWKPTSVTYDRDKGNSWHLASSPPGRRVRRRGAVHVPPSKLYIDQVSQKAENTGRTQEVAGRTWQRWEGSKYDALVREEKGATTVVTGSAPPAERLAEMAAALR